MYASNYKGEGLYPCKTIARVLLGIVIGGLNYNGQASNPIIVDPVEDFCTFSEERFCDKVVIEKSMGIKYWSTLVSFDQCIIL